MKPEPISTPHTALLVSLFALTLSGCAALAPLEGDQPGKPATELPVDQRVVHTAQTSASELCGDLSEYVLDIHKLELPSQAALLDELEASTGKRYYCDRLKTGILLSQIGRTIEEDDQAIEILEAYRSSEQLTADERWLVKLLLRQSRERRRLHVLLEELGNQLITQRSLSKTLTTDLVTLRQQLDQLQKIEADINETQQSISTPAAAVDQPTTPNTGS